MIKTRNAEYNLTIFLQGDLADFNLLSGDGLSVTCHSVMFVGLSKFLSDLVGSCGPGADQVVFPDFTITELCAVVNLLYTGM